MKAGKEEVDRFLERMESSDLLPRGENEEARLSKGEPRDQDT